MVPRLPKNVKPSHYDLDLKLDLKNLTFTGSVVTHLDVLEPTTSIVLHSNDLEISETTIRHSSRSSFPGIIQKVPPTAIQHDKPKKQITIPLVDISPLSKFTKITLHQSFHGKIKRHGATPGLQYQDYRDGQTGMKRRAVFTTCEPIGARCIFPCFDEPDLKATMSSSVTIISQPPDLLTDLTCLSNMDIVSSTTQTDPQGKLSKRVTFHKTPLMSTYLIVFVIGEFESISSSNSASAPKSPVVVRLWAVRSTPFLLRKRGHKMLSVAVRALSLFSTLFGVEYPLPKLDLVAFPEAGGLENWGCVVFGERFLLGDEATTSAKNWQTSVETLCHELAHQWFGNLVTMSWWDDLWLSEAFAQWAGFFVADKMFPDWDHWTHFVSADPDPEAMPYYQGALDLDSKKEPASTHPVYNADASPDQFGDLFDNITYMKGAGLIRMLYQFVGGEDVFFKGVKEYLRRHAFGNATHEDLWDALAFATGGSDQGKDVRGFMENWIKHVGYPVLFVSEVFDEDDKSLQERRSPKTITIEQHRYLQSVPVSPEDDQKVYQVPLNWIIGDGKNLAPSENKGGSSLLHTRKAIYEPPPLGIATESESEFFYKLNADQIGLYRVSYPRSRLQKLASSSSGNHLAKLSPKDRVGLVSDTHALVSSWSVLESENCPEDNEISTVDLLDLLLAFLGGGSEESNFLVWRQVFFTIGKVRQAFLFASSLGSAQNGNGDSGDNQDSNKISIGLENFHRRLVLRSLSQHSATVVATSAANGGGGDDKNEIWNIKPTDGEDAQNAKALFFSQAAVATSTSPATATATASAAGTNGYHNPGSHSHHREEEGTEGLQEIAKKLFDNFISFNNKNNNHESEASLNPNIRKYVFQAVARSNDPFRYNQLLNLSLTTNSPEIRTDAFVSLAYSTSPALIESVAFPQMTDPSAPFSWLERWFFLNGLLSGSTAPSTATSPSKTSPSPIGVGNSKVENAELQDGNGTSGGIVGNRLNNGTGTGGGGDSEVLGEQAWTWLKQQWKEITEGETKVSESIVGWYVNSCLGSFSTQKQLENVEKFRDSDVVDDNFKKAFDEALEGIRARKAWVERDYKGVEAWLKEHGFSSSSVGQLDAGGK